MENIKPLNLSDEQIISRWRVYHPNDSIKAVGKGNSGLNTVLDEEIDLDLVRYITIYTQFMVA
jgi:hypothetical protein